MTMLAAQTATFASQWGRSEGGGGRRGSYSQLTVACLNVDDRPFSITYLILIALNMCVHAAHGIVLLPLYPTTPLPFSLFLLLCLSLSLSVFGASFLWHCQLAFTLSVATCQTWLMTQPRLATPSSPASPTPIPYPTSARSTLVPCVLPAPSPSLSVYLASAASFYELCRALMLITL